MFINVSELLIAVAISQADMYSPEKVKDMSLEEAAAFANMLGDMAKVVSVIQDIPPIIVEVLGDESFVYTP